VCDSRLLRNVLKVNIVRFLHIAPAHASSRASRRRHGAPLGERCIHACLVGVDGPALGNPAVDDELAVQAPIIPFYEAAEEYLVSARANQNFAAGQLGPFLDQMWVK
jgi:hypothetical protein